jgi:hypothetical protein
MEIKSHNIYVENLTQDDLRWFVETAAVNMLTDELNRPELINLDQLYLLATKGMNEGTAFIAKKGYEPVGALGAILSPNLYNPNITTLSELFWYVLPEHRNTRAGVLLFSAFNSKGESLADEANLSLLGSSTINMKTLEKRGFLLKEFAFTKEYRKT